MHFIGISKMGAVAKRSRKQIHYRTLIEVFHMHISQEKRDDLRVQIYWLIQLVKSNIVQLLREVDTHNHDNLRTCYTIHMS